MDPLKIEIELDNQQNIIVRNRENTTELTYLISEVGINAIKKFARENQIIQKTLVWETRDHDGYDRYGPKSDIWNLYIEYQNRIYKFHREDWWYDVEKDDYVLCR